MKGEQKMLNELELRAIVDEAIVRFAVVNDGVKGWRKEDLEKAVTERGGDKNDLYRAMELGFEACFGDILENDRLLS